MDSWNLILDIVVTLAVAMGLGILFEKVGWNAIIGFLLAGIIVGPSLLNMVQSVEAVRVLAELGIVLIMFTIGLEFSWSRLRKFGSKALISGGLQLVITGLITFLVCIFTGFEIKAAMALAFIVAMSSTAVVLSVLAHRTDTESIRGRNSLGVLLIQDIAIVPMILILTALGGGSEAGGAVWESLFLSFGKTMGLIGLVYVICRYLVPRILNAKSLVRNRDLIILLSFTMCLSSAWFAHALGLSASLGAFVAGIFLGETKFNEQIQSDVNPLKTIFVTLFFTSVGMLADVSWIIDHALLVLLVSLIVILMKSYIIYFVFRVALKQSNVLSFATGFTLAQIGELSFVLAALALNLKLFDPNTFQLVIATTLLTLMVTPFLVGSSINWAVWLSKPMVRWRIWEPESFPEKSESEGLRNHVILVGFGPAGEKVHRFLKDSNVPTVVLETNPKTVEEIRKQGIHAEVGDAVRSSILNFVGIQKAKALVVTIPDFRAARSIIHTARTLAPKINIIARARYNTYAEDLKNAGANLVLNEEEQTGTLLGMETLKQMGLFKTRKKVLVEHE